MDTTFGAPEAGPSWAERARLDPLAAVLDPSDAGGAKNRLIDRAQKLALAGALGDVRGAAVLDFGCGTGRVSHWLVCRGARVEGVDITAEMIDVAVTAGVLQYHVEGDGTIPAEIARVLRPSGRLIAIEQVTDGALGRGGPFDAYRKLIAGAGLHVVDATLIRLGDSRIVGLAQRWPPLGLLPLVPRLVALEARRSAGVPLTGGRYADALFRAVKPERSTGIA